MKLEMTKKQLEKKHRIQLDGFEIIDLVACIESQNAHIQDTQTFKTWMKLKKYLIFK